MSSLQIFSDSAAGAAPLQSSTDAAEIAALLKRAGIRFEQWHTGQTLAFGTDQDTVMTAYRDDIERLVGEQGYRAVDVISLDATHPDKDTLRKKFLSEHTHSEDEVRFFVAGRGLFSLHLGDAIYEVLCEQGDLISVPANTPHWFDMGSQPRFIAIRFFNNPEGWVARYTDSAIADRFSRLD